MGRAVLTSVGLEIKKVGEEYISDAGSESNLTPSTSIISFFTAKGEAMLKQESIIRQLC